MLRVAVLLAVFIVQASAAGNGTAAKFDANCSPSYMAKTKSCLDSYFSGYGFNPAKLPPYSTYVKTIVDLTTHFGANGIDIFCSFGVSVENCLGPLFNSPCMTAGAFQYMYGMSVSESYEYATDFPVRAYMCDNKQFMKDNNDCFDDVHTNHLDERKACSAAVEDALKQVTNGDYCQPWGDFITCTDDVYVKHCGQQVKGYICSVLEVGINFDSMNSCKNNLPVLRMNASPSNRVHATPTPIVCASALDHQHPSQPSSSSEPLTSPIASSSRFLLPVSPETWPTDALDTVFDDASKQQWIDHIIDHIEQTLEPRPLSSPPQFPPTIVHSGLQVPEPFQLCSSLPPVLPSPPTPHSLYSAASDSMLNKRIKSLETRKQLLGIEWDAYIEKTKKLLSGTEATWTVASYNEVAAEYALIEKHHNSEVAEIEKELSLMMQLLHTDRGTD